MCAACDYLNLQLKRLIILLCLLQNTRNFSAALVFSNRYSMVVQYQANQLEANVEALTDGFNSLDEKMSSVTSIATKFGDRLQVDQRSHVLMGTVCIVFCLATQVVIAFLQNSV